MRSGCAIGEGRDTFAYWRRRIEQDGLDALFLSAPHAEKLRRVGFETDIPFCAQVDITAAVPTAAERHPLGVILRNAP